MHFITRRLAALCFDRVWWGSAEGIPPSIAFGCFDSDELGLISGIDLLVESLGGSRFNEKGSVAPAGGLLPEVVQLTHEINTIVTNVYAKHDFKMVPLFSSSADLKIEYGVGTDNVAVAALKNVALVDEKALDWNQVIELRSDHDSIRKYRRLVHWLDADLAGKPATFVEQEIEKRLDDYKWALKKHGLNTVIGALSEVLNWKWFTAATAFGALTSYASGNSPAAFVATTAVIVGKTALEVARIGLARADIRQANSHLALVHEVQNSTTHEQP